MKLDQPDRPKPGDDGIGFFGCVRVGNEVLHDAVIKNLTIDSSCEIKGSSDHVAGIVGRIHQRTGSNTLLIENCVNKANVTTSANHVAGIVGQINTIGGSTVTIKNCTNEGAITTTGAYAAGILAQINDANTSTVNIIGCTNKGAVQTAGICAAGIVSQANNCTVALNIESCMNLAEVKSTGNKNCGGIHGANTSSRGTIKILYCGNTGNVTGTDESAALTGWMVSLPVLSLRQVVGARTLLLILALTLVVRIPTMLSCITAIGPRNRATIRLFRMAILRGLEAFRPLRRSQMVRMARPRARATMSQSRRAGCCSSLAECCWA